MKHDQNAREAFKHREEHPKLSASLSLRPEVLDGSVAVCITGQLRGACSPADVATFEAVFLAQFARADVFVVTNTEECEKTKGTPLRRGSSLPVAGTPQSLAHSLF